MSDPIQPKHYHDKDGSGIHCHNAQAAALSKEGFQAYMIGCAIKYIWRWKDKNGQEDLRKAQHCLTMVLDTMENGSDTTSKVSVLPADGTSVSKQSMAEGEAWFVHGTKIQRVVGPER